MENIPLAWHVYKERELKIWRAIMVLSILLFLLTSLFALHIFLPPGGKNIEPAFVSNTYNIDPCGLKDIVCDDEPSEAILKPTKIKAYVTAYSLREAETDSTPTISASGEDIAGRKDAVACPRNIPFHTIVEILGNDYVCLDRMAYRFNDRFDISFDKDVQGAKEFGKQELEVTIWQ